MDYQYPLDYEWSTKEIVDVIKFYEAVEKAYEQGVKQEELMNAYRRFKEIVPGKAEEKKIDAEFEEISGYSCYRAVQKAKEAEKNNIIKL
ncbi:MAG: UPF0223 family protein [Ectobacillus sp.]